MTHSPLISGAERSRADIGPGSAFAERMRSLGFSAWIRQTVGTAERGRRRITAEEMVGLAQALGAPVAALLPCADTYSGPAPRQPEL